MSTSDPKYDKAISKGLDAAYKRAEERPFDPATERIAIFSDHHKGVGDPADDFRRCEHAYAAALGYYLEAGYRLFVLGDAEELWEERAGPVLKRYDAVLRLEGEFAKRCNAAMVDLEAVTDADSQLKPLIENHQKYTGSKRAAEILAAWPQQRAKFVKVFPKEYRRALAELAQKKAAA